MNNYFKDSIFWYYIEKLVKKDDYLKKLLKTKKEEIHYLFTIYFFGLHQYALYNGTSIEPFQMDDSEKYFKYIIANFESLHKGKYKYQGTMKYIFDFDSEEDIYFLKTVFERMFLPYINKFNFEDMKDWKDIYKAYIAEFMLIYEKDINHISDERGRTSGLVYPFLLTLVLIENNDPSNIYKLVKIFYKKDKILKAYNEGRKWSKKEEDYLKPKLELLNSSEEWNLFLSNFKLAKWNEFDFQERFRVIYELSIFTGIYIKEKIDSITMMNHNREQFQILEKYLLLFISIDKDFKNTKVNKYLSPFLYLELNFKSLSDYYTKSGKLDFKYDDQLLKSTCKILISIKSKLRTMFSLINTFPPFLEFEIAKKRKILTSILKVFDKNNQLNFNIKPWNFKLSNYFISDEELKAFNKFKKVESISILDDAIVIKKIAKIMSFMLGLNKNTAYIYSYNIGELIKYILMVFGPHNPKGNSLGNKVIKKVEKILIECCLMYEKEVNHNSPLSEKLSNTFNLPLRLYRFQKK